MAQILTERVETGTKILICLIYPKSDLDVYIYHDPIYYIYILVQRQVVNGTHGW